MGTKTVDQIRTKSLGLKSVDRSSSGFISFGVNGQLKSSQEKDEKESFVIVKSMDRFLEKQSVESIKHTMQAQEYIFKQQVRELHRVYNIQKTMMDQLKHRSQHSTITNKDQTGSREITETTTTTDCYIEEREIELTLSIGMSSSSSSSTTKRSSSDTCNNQSNNNNYSHNNNNQEKSRSSTTSLDREKKKKIPHNWLFHGLTINPTS